VTPPARQASDLDFTLPPGPGRRAKKWLLPDGPGAVRSISVAEDGTCAIAYEAPRHAPDSDCEVHVRSGPDLQAQVARYEALRAPVALTRDGRRLAAAETVPPGSERTSPSPGVRVIEVGDGTEGVHWPLQALFGWTPSGETLVALTRRPGMRPPVMSPVIPPAAVVDDLLGLERDAKARLVAADVVRAEVAALDRHRVLGGTLYQGAQLAVTGDGAVAIVHTSDYGVYSRLVGFSVATGELVWSQPALTEKKRLFREPCRAAATSPCGRLAAFASAPGPRGRLVVRIADNALPEDVNLTVLDTATGRVVLALDTRELGSDKAPNALCFHPSGWLAVGFGDGRVAHVTMTGSSTVYRAVSRAISALAFTSDGARLLVGGSDPRGLCAVELTAAERNPLEQSAR